MIKYLHTPLDLIFSLNNCKNEHQIDEINKGRKNCQGCYFT